MSTVLNHLIAGSFEILHNGKKVTVTLADYVQGLQRKDIETLDNARQFFGDSIALKLIHCGLRQEKISMQNAYRAKDESGAHVDPAMQKVNKRVKEHKPTLLWAAKTGKQAELALEQAKEMVSTGIPTDTIEKVLKVGKYSQTAIDYALNQINS